MNEAQNTSHSNHPLLTDLTVAQRKAVLTTEGPLLVLAAAGSGKTRVITRRVCWLVNECGIPPFDILTITFTNKAAGEMRDRLSNILTPRQSQSVNCYTFHALCARLLRRYADALNLPSDYSIYDTTDQKAAYKTVFEEMDISKEHFAPAAVAATISNAKNQLKDPQLYKATAQDFYTRKVAMIYEKYQAILTQNNALDFDDLLLKVAQLLQQNEEVRNELQQQFQYIMVDEYQDTNHVQFVIAQLLSGMHRNIMVVGDPDQSIYGWRGADINNILDFETSFEDAQVLELGQNYRSTPQILEAADKLINHNKQRKPKPLWTMNNEGEHPTVLTTTDGEHESDMIVQRMKDLHDKGQPWSEMAVFYRTNALSRVVEESLLKAGVPYQIARGTAFYQRKEIKDAVAYVRVLVNPADEVALLRIINTPTRGIGKTTINHIRNHAAQHNMHVWDVMLQIDQVIGLNTRAKSAINRFLDLYRQWHNKLDSDDTENFVFASPSVRDLIEDIIRESNLEKHYQKEDEEKLENLSELISAAARFDEEYGEDEAKLRQRLRDYLESISLVSDVDGLESADGSVSLMTLHAAKGLEFDHVYIIGLEDALLPHSRSFEAQNEMEEERRLLFVGMTRARKALTMTHAKMRTVRGMRDRTIQSQFISEIPKELLQFEDLSPLKPEYGDFTQSGFGDDFAPRFNEDFDTPGSSRSTGSKSSDDQDNVYGQGVYVRHPQFGLGRVISTAGRGRNARVRVNFDSVGVKTLVVEYARLEPVDY